MTKEVLIIGVPAVSWVLFSLGGIGPKWIRRFFLSCFLGGIALLTGFIWWKVALFTLSLMVVLCLPYGNNTPILGRGVVILCYGLAFLPLKLTPIVLIPPITFGLFYWLSLKYNWLSWKIVEGLVGLSLGITLLLM